MSGIILVTTESKPQAKKIAKTLVNMKLAACVNITTPVTSIYFWENKIQESREYLLIIKTVKKNYKKIEIKIKELHSYKNPEIIFLSVDKGSKEYLDWIKKNSIS